MSVLYITVANNLVHATGYQYFVQSALKQLNIGNLGDHKLCKPEVIG